MTPKQFRLLILVPWLLFGLYAVTAGLAARALPPELQRAGIAGFPAPWLAAVSLVVFAANIWASVELYRFRNVGRILFVGILVVGYAQAPFLPPTVLQASSAAILSIQGMASGALLAAMFWSPVATRFKVRPSAA